MDTASTHPSENTPLATPKEEENKPIDPPEVNNSRKFPKLPLIAIGIIIVLFLAGTSWYVYSLKTTKTSPSQPTSTSHVTPTIAPTDAPTPTAIYVPVTILPTVVTTPTSGPTPTKSGIMGFDISEENIRLDNFSSGDVGKCKDAFDIVSKGATQWHIDSLGSYGGPVGLEWEKLNGTLSNGERLKMRICMVKKPDYTNAGFNMVKFKFTDDTNGASKDITVSAFVN